MNLIKERLSLRHPGHALLVALICLLVYLASCSPAGIYSPGFDALAPKGRYASIVEPAAGTPPAILSVVDLENGQVLRSLKDAALRNRPASQLSPDGKFLLYKLGDDWQLVNVASGQEWTVGQSIDQVDFLPDGQLLIRHTVILGEEETSPEYGFKMWILSTANPEADRRSVVTEYGLFGFESHNMPTYTGFLSLFPGNIKPLQAVCPPQSVMERLVYIIIDADGRVKVVTGHAERVQVEDLSHLSSQTMELLRDRERQLAALLGAVYPASPPKTPEPAASPDPTSVAGETQDSIQRDYILASLARSGITGQASPDGRHLVLLSITSMPDQEHKRFSLDLVDLAQDTIVSLSADTQWIPGFLFSPDGSQILFESARGGGRAWYLASSNGTDIQRLDLGETEIACWN